MIAVDTNILVYAHRADSPFHAKAKQLLESLRVSPAAWAIPWPCVHEFLAIASHPRIYKNPTPIETAFAAIDTWNAAGNLHCLAESGTYLAKLRELCVKARLAGPRIHDARIAAVCLNNGVQELWTADRDFSAFPQLNIRNPLVTT
jgi:toxin-antitoxin system PIN domain toxin